MLPNDNPAARLSAGRRIGQAGGLVLAIVLVLRRRRTNDEGRRWIRKVATGSIGYAFVLRLSSFVLQHDYEDDNGNARPIPRHFLRAKSRDNLSPLYSRTFTAEPS